MDKHVQTWINKKINDMDPNERELAVSNIIREGGVLGEIYLGCAERVIKALFLMNSGGVITVLTYLHNSDYININEKIKFWWLLMSLKIFILGLLCAFILVACDYLTVTRRYFRFISQKQSFLSNDVHFSCIAQFQLRDNSCMEKISYGLLVYGAGAISFISAVVGIVVGMYGYFYV